MTNIEYQWVRGLRKLKSKRKKLTIRELLRTHRELGSGVGFGSNGGNGKGT